MKPNLESHKPDEGAIREGEPPYVANTQRKADTPPDLAGSSLGHWLGATSLVCAIIAWLGTCLSMSAEFGGAPKALTHNPISFLILIGCMSTAIIGGAYSGLIWRSVTGYLGLVLGLLHLLAVLSCVWLLSSGQLGPAWMD